MTENYRRLALLIILWVSCCVLRGGADIVDRQIRQLRSDDPWACGDAAEALGECRDARAVDPLITTMKDNHQALSVRAVAAKALGQIKDVRAVDPLIATLKDSESSSVRVAAAEALAQIKDVRAVDPLITTLNDNNLDVRVAAAKALEYIGGDRAVAAFKDSEWGAAVAVVKAIVDANGAGIDPLVAALEDDKVTVREAAIRVLGQMKDPRAIEPLISTLKDSEVGVRVAAVEALGQMKDPQAVKLSVVALLQYESLLGPLSRAELKAVQRVFLNIGSPAVNPLVEGLKGSNAKVYIAAAHTLGLLKDPRAIDPLLVALGDKKERVRDSRDTVEWWQMHEAAMRALGQIRDPRAVDALLAAFKDKDRSVHGPAAVALGQTRDSRVVDALLAAFKDKDGSMRGPAAAALGQTQDPRAVDALLAALTDQNSYTRAMAAGALDQIEDVRVVDALITTMKDSDSSVRAAAAWSLGCIGDDRAMTALASAMPDPEVGAGIGNALVRLGWQPQAARDEVYLWICRKQQDELLRTWEVTCRVLFEDMLSSEEKRVDNAVFTFISLGREEVIPKLVSVLNEHGNKAMALTYLTEFSKSKDTMALPTAILHVR